MKIASIIAEYNPFHAGHFYHIAQTRAAGATHIVVIMSGNSVQRGEFAIFRKEARARMALENGADLVICLPTPWSCARAQDFSRAAVHLANALGCVEMLSFGSECGDINILKRAAALLQDGEVVKVLKTRIGEGRGFASARQIALAQVDFAASQCLRKPNDTLNVEYITALAEQQSSIAPLAVPRTGGEGYQNASELRIILKKEEFAKENIGSELLRFEYANGFAPVKTESLEAAILARLRTMTVEDYAHLPDISEGMEHLLHHAARQGGNLDKIFSAAVGRRYPKARLRRILFHALLCVTNDDFAALPRYIQVLGCNVAGHEVLRRMKATATLPVICRHADIKNLDTQGLRQYQLECRATDLMALAMPEVQPCGMEERRQFISLA